MQQPVAFGGNPFGFDNGYFNSNAGAQTTAQVFWNGVFQTATTVTAGTDYLSQWQVTDGSGNPYHLEYLHISRNDFGEIKHSRQYGHSHTVYQYQCNRSCLVLQQSLIG